MKIRLLVAGDDIYIYDFHDEEALAMQYTVAVAANLDVERFTVDEAKWNDHMKKMFEEDGTQIIDCRKEAMRG